MDTKQEKVSEFSRFFKKLFRIERGDPQPFGATLKPNGINFSIFSKHATSVTLVLFVTGENDPIAEISLDPNLNKTGDVWHIFIRGMDSKIRYGYRIDMQPNPAPHLHLFDPSVILIDPYAKALSGGSVWGQPYRRTGEADEGQKIRKRRSLVLENTFDWEDCRPINLPLSDSIIYELHIRGFTCHPSSGVKHPGTFLGLIEKIPYLKELGVTAVELLPINEFEEGDTRLVNPFTNLPILNFWGYHPICFFAPKAAYAVQGRDGQQVNEFKTLVKAFHKAGIEVILDVVFNHTAEGDEDGHTFCFRGIDNSVYYMVDPQTGKNINFSGCGNTINCNHPIVRDMIIDCLHHWVTEMHVDGFRFDLASILGRGQDGTVLSNPPLLEHIAADPILAKTKLIAEAWDAAGLYQVGSFPAWGRWAEWNGKFRDDIRRFVKSDGGMVPALAQRWLGSPDLYSPSGRAPYHSINFITSHDGFTVADLVSYNLKHNEANGESNKDGTIENYSWNCGCEGPTDSTEIRNLRLRQIKNFATLLLLSSGVPMILAGDEFGKTQQGNNNAYCQDNEVSWVNWELMEKNAEQLRFYKQLIQLRKKHPFFRYNSFDELWKRDLVFEFHGMKLGHPDWSFESRSLGLYIARRENPEGTHAYSDQYPVKDMYLIANSHWESHEFELPKLAEGKFWYRIIDTSLTPPLDIAEEGTEQLLGNQQSYWVGSRSVVVLMVLANQDIHSKSV